MSRAIDIRIARVEKQIEKLSDYLASLKAEKDSYVAPVQGIDYGFLPLEDPDMWRVVDFIKENAGCDRADIRSACPEFDEKKITNILTKARRNYGIIENRGNIPSPRWFIREGE